jgi:hypothetical protein
VSRKHGLLGQDGDLLEEPPPLERVAHVLRERDLQHVRRQALDDDVAAQGTPPLVLGLDRDPGLGVGVLVIRRLERRDHDAQAVQRAREDGQDLAERVGREEASQTLCGADIAKVARVLSLSTRGGTDQRLITRLMAGCVPKTRKVVAAARTGSWWDPRRDSPIASGSRIPAAAPP